MKSMASAVSASASGQLLPASSTSRALKSSRRLRTSSAASNKNRARSRAVVARHSSKRWNAASIASAACSTDADETSPTISLGCAGLMELNVCAVSRFLPSITKGYRAASPSRARRIAAWREARSAGFLKSRTLSFRKGAMVRWAVVVMPPTSTPARKVLVPSASKTPECGTTSRSSAAESSAWPPLESCCDGIPACVWSISRRNPIGINIRAATTAASSTRASTTNPARSKRSCAWRAASFSGITVPKKNVGKLIVATHEAEIPRLMDLYERGRANGVERLELLDGAQIREREPHCRGIKAISSPVTGIVDYRVIARSYAADVKALGGELLLSHEISGFRRRNGVTLLESPAGDVESRHTVTCAGLYSDALARMTGGAPDPKIVPFRGDYLILKPEKRYLVSGNIYPVPDPNFPFLGVHFTPRMDGEIWLGPNAVLAFAREGYRFSDVKAKELLDAVAYPGFLRLALKYWQTGAGEMFRDLSRKAYVKALQRYIPELQPEDCLRGPSGVRAQAMRANGELVDDFVFDGAEGIVHVRNAPSPGATSSLAIARFIADEAERRFDLTTGSTIAT